MQNFAAIDFETANGKRSSICSVGVVVVHRGQIVRRFHRLVKPMPNFYFRFFTESIHGIGYDDTKNELPFPQVWAQVEPLIEGLPLVAHNAGFDEGALRGAYEAYGMDYPSGYRFYCTLRAARRMFPGSVIENHRLPTVCAHLGIEMGQHHDALADAEACAKIAIQIL